jgi:uncharacterized protein YfaS (alpha-2-macroglobulin family)
MKTIPLMTKTPAQRRLWMALTVLVIVSLACNLGQPTSTPLTPSPTSTPPTAQATQPPQATPAVEATPRPRQPLPPALVETSPLPGSELPLKGALTLVFNQAMDRLSVEGAIQSQPSPGVAFKWMDDTTLVLTPDQPFLPDTPVSLTIGSTARAANGLALTDPVTLSYQSVSELRLAQTLPLDGAGDIDPSSAVVASFNRPVVALGSDPASQPAAFSLQPPVQGRGEWINTSTYIFYPQPSLAGGTQYTVQLDPGLTSVDGAPLDSGSPITWRFTTPVPAVVQTEPAKGDLLRLDQAVKVTFNVDMDPASLAGNFSLTSSAGEAVAGQITWEDNGRIMTFTPENLLQRDTAYILQVSAQARALGGMPLGENARFQFRTYPALSLLGSTPANGEQLDTPYSNSYSSVSLDFSAPLQNKNFKNKLSLNPPVSGLSVYLNNDGRRVTLSGYYAFKTQYTLTVSADLADAWGTPLGQSQTIQFSTGAAAPDFSIPSLYYTGSLVFVTTMDTGLAANATNLTQVGLTQGSITLADLFELLGPNGYEALNAFTPAKPASWTQTLKLTPDRSQSISLPLTPAGKTLAPGLYYYSAQAKELPGDRGSRSTPFLVVASSIHLTFKMSATQATLWATRLQDQSPLSAATVKLYNEKGEEVASGQTDAQGLYQADLGVPAEPYSSYYAVVGQPGDPDFSLATSAWNQGLMGYEFGLPTDFSAPGVKAYTYTDRPIYRPGQTVNYRAILRQADNGRYQWADLAQATVHILGDTGMMGEAPMLLDQVMPLSAFGALSGAYSLPESAAPGYYQINIIFADQQVGTVGFQVANYRKPEINLQVSLGAEAIQRGQPIQVDISARYFFGAPAGNQPVSWALYRAPRGFSMPGYQVGVLDTSWLSPRWAAGFYSGELGTVIAQGEGHTQVDGSLKLSLSTADLLADAPDGTQTLTLEVTIQDASGRPVSQRAAVTVHPADFYIGIRPDGWSGVAGQSLGFSLQTADWQNKPKGSQALEAAFVKVEWVEQDTTDDMGTPIYVEQTTPVGSASPVTDGSGQARLAFTPPDPGTYRLEVKGGGAVSQALIWVRGPSQAAWPDLPNQRLLLTADASLYQPGQDAQVFIPNPFPQDALALVTTERSQVMSAQVVHVTGSGITLPIPLRGRDAPNVYLSVTLLGSTADGQPAFRQGYLNLEVDPAALLLNVKMTTQPEVPQPGQPVTISLQVSDAEGKPVQGEFSLAVVDLAALALAEPNSPGIRPAYYGTQPLGVRTSLSLAGYAGRSVLQPPGRGGGGEGMAAPEVRQNFPDTAYWNAAIVTDANGAAQVTFTLPDNLTTWQADVRGITMDSRVGEATTQMVTSKDLLVRLVTPRFLVAGDHTELAAIVHNNTANDLKVEVSLEATGVSLDDPAHSTQTVNVPAGGQMRAAWWVTAQDAAEADLVFSAKAGSLQDSARPETGKLSIRRYASLQTFSTAGVLSQESERLEVVSLPRPSTPAFPAGFTPTGGELRVELSPSLAAVVFSGLDALETEEFTDTSTTLSRFLPVMAAYIALKDLGIDSPGMQDRLERTAVSGVRRLLESQNGDGGWSWWSPGFDPNAVSDPYLSAYILFGLAEANQAGIFVNSYALQRAVGYLQIASPAPDPQAPAWQLDRLAFQMFALLQAGASNPDLPEILFTQRSRLSPWANALTALALQAASPNDERVQTLLSDLQSTAVRSATGVNWESTTGEWRNPGTPIFTSAVVLYTLATLDPANPLLTDAVRYLAANRNQASTWGSPYESAWVLLALTQAMRGTGEMQASYNFSVDINDTPLASGQAGGSTALTPVTSVVPLANLFSDGPNALRIRRDPGAGKLYYRADLRLDRPVESAQPLERGLAISRAYYLAGQDCTQTTCQPVSEVALSGDPANPSAVTVRLTLTLPHDMYHLVVEDNIPAGAEVYNPRLKTSQQGLEQQPQDTPLYAPNDPYRDGWGWWFFADPQVYDDHVLWTADFLPAGTYQLTYRLIPVQAGEYRAIPARAWQFFFPEVQGATAGAVFKIK